MTSIRWFDINKQQPKTTLPKEVVSHINKITNKEFIKVSKLGWSILIETLTNNYGVDFKNDKILFSKNGKPYLKSKKIYFSLSHSLNLVAIAISNRCVGIDVEKIIPDHLCELLSKRILTQKQYNEYVKHKDKSHYLTKIWTQKEAYVKCFDKSILNVEVLKSINSKDKNTTLVNDSLNNKYYISYCEK